MGEDGLALSVYFYYSRYLCMDSGIERFVV